MSSRQISVGKSSTMIQSTMRMMRWTVGTRSSPEIDSKRKWRSRDDWRSTIPLSNRVSWLGINGKVRIIHINRMNNETRGIVELVLFSLWISSPFYLLLAQPTKPELQQTNQSLIENSRATFICSTKGGNPLPTFHWFINQIRLNE